MNKKLLFVAIGLLISLIGFTQTWDGSTSTDWNTASNWSTNAVPASNGSVIISGTGITNWPVLSSNVTVGKFTMNTGSQLTTGGFNITTATGGFDITGATINNNIAANTSLIYVPGGGSNINGSTFNGNFHFSTTSANQTTNEASTAPNTWNGNVTFTAGLRETLSISENFASAFNGDVTVRRLNEDEATMEMFRAGGVVIKGNFSYTNPKGVLLRLGTKAGDTRISGTLNINSQKGSVYIYRIKNKTGGGEIRIDGYSFMDIEEDSLVVNSFNGSSATGQVHLKDNYITGSVNMTNSGGNTFYLDGNIFTSDVSFTKTVGGLSEAWNKANTYFGNASFIITNSTVSPSIIGHSDTSSFYKNVTVNISGNSRIQGLKFVGNQNSEFTQLGAAPIPVWRLIMEKTGGARLTLNSPIAITTDVRFTSGCIYTTAANYLRFNNHVNISEGNNTSHVVGPVQKLGVNTGGFTFPVGSSNNYHPVKMTSPLNATDLYSAEYFKRNPSDDGYNINLKAASLQRISGCEYWDVKRLNGASNVTLTFTFTDACSGTYITDPAKVKIARWAGSLWEDLGNGGSTGTTSGTVTSEKPVTAFGPFSFASVDINVNPLSGSGNTPPLVTASAGNTNYTSGTPVAIDGAISVTDPDNANLASATVSISTGFLAAQDVLLFTNQNGITGTYNTSTGVLMLTGSATLANYQTALRSVQYNNTSITPNTSNRIISFQVNDGTANSNIATKTVTLTAVNNLPVITASGGNTAYVSGTPVVVDGAITVTDPDNANLASATISITTGFQSGQDVLQFTNQNGITGSYNAAIGVLSLTGSSTIENYQTALRSVRYNNTSITPNTANRTLSFQVNDGTANSNIAAKTITITAVNNPPVVITSAGNTAYTSGTPAAIDGAITVTDPDNGNLTSATITITTGFQSAQDVLQFTNQNGITGTYNTSTGLLTLTGSATLANYQTALRSVQFNNTSLTPNTTNRTISFQVNDGVANSNIATKTITLTAVNNPPVVTTSAGNTAYTSGNPVAIDGAINTTDPDDANLASATISITTGFQSGQDVLQFTNQNGITGAHNSANGLLTLTGSSSIANYQTALRSVRYNNTSITPNTANRTISFRANDGTGNSNVATKTVTVTAVNIPPIITAPPGNVEYLNTSFSSKIGDNIVITDADDQNLVSATITIIEGFDPAADDISFTNQNGITGSYGAAGVFTLTGISSVANYQAAIRSLVYSNIQQHQSVQRKLSFRVNDGTDNSNLLTRIISTVNTPPVVTASAGVTTYTRKKIINVDPGIIISNPGTSNLISSSVSISTGYQPSNDRLLFTNQNGITGNFNVAAGILTLSGSSLVANYQAALRSIQYNTTQDFFPDVANKQNRIVTFQVYDGIAYSNFASKRINTPPEVFVSALAGGASFRGSPVVIAEIIDVLDIDNQNIASATVIITSPTFIASEDRLLFTNQNGISGNYNTSTGVLILTGSSSVSNYTAALRSVRYNNTSSTPKTNHRIISFQVNDGIDNSNLPVWRLFIFRGGEIAKIYPNPAKNNITIEGTISGLQVQLKNSMGQVLKTITASGTSVGFNISSLASGKYYVDINQGGLLIGRINFLKL